MARGAHGHGGTLGFLTWAAAVGCAGRVDDSSRSADAGAHDAALRRAAEAGSAMPQGPYCHSDRECPDPALPVCDSTQPYGWVCVECLSDPHCSRDAHAPHCDANRHCVPCVTDQHCGGDFPRCSQEFQECTRACTGDADCTDPKSPVCDTAGALCVPCIAGKDCWDPNPSYCHDEHCYSNAGSARCASADTLVATPDGPVRISDVRTGDRVYSVEGSAFVVAEVIRTASVPVTRHHLLRVELEDGEVVAMSREHPLADGRVFEDLVAGAELGTARVRRVTEIPYGFHRTYDILPATSTGAWVTSGVVVGSTLAPRSPDEPLRP
jgi:hypothetical protein